MDQEALIQNIATALKDSGIVLSNDTALEKAKLILGKVEVYQPEKPPELEVVKFEEPETQPEPLETYAPDKPEIQKPIEPNVPDEPDFQGASDRVQEPHHDTADVIPEPIQEQTFEQETPFPDHSKEEDKFVEKYSEILEEEFKASQEDAPEHHEDVIPEPEAPDEEVAKPEICDVPPAHEDTQEQKDFEPETSNAAEEVAKPEPWVVPPAHEHSQTNIGDFKIGDTRPTPQKIHQSLDQEVGHKPGYDPSSPEYDVTRDTRTLGEIQRVQEEMHEAQPEEPKSEHPLDDADDWEEDDSIPPPKEEPKNDEFVSDEEFEDEDLDFSPPPRPFPSSDEESAEES